MQNAIPDRSGEGGETPPGAPGPPRGTAGVAGRIVQRSLAAREASYADEVQRLLDAGLALMTEAGTDRSPRVVDIIAAAGLSNDAFYRHFSGKDELVAAILEAGSTRLAGYLEHQMSKAADPAGRLRAWMTGMMAQAANPAVADATRAVLWNGSSLSDRTRGPVDDPPHRTLLPAEIAALGSTDVARDVALVFHATVGQMQEFLWRRVAPTDADVEHLVTFCLAGLAAGAARDGRT